MTSPKLAIASGAPVQSASSRMRSLQDSLRNEARTALTQKVDEIKALAASLDDFASLDIYDASARESMKRLSAALSVETAVFSKTINRLTSNEERPVAKVAA